MAVWLTDDEVKGLLDMPTCIDALEKSYVALGNEMALNRPLSFMHAATRKPGRFFRFTTMDGILQSEGVAAMRVEADVMEWPESNGRRQIKIPALPGNRYSGLLFLFSIETGEILAVMQDSFLQRMRVGATSALAAKYLARQDAEVVGLLGSGTQARTQLMGLASVRPIRQVRVFSPNSEHRGAFATEMQEELGIPVQAAAQAKDAVDGADIICCATNSMHPLVKKEWVRPGLYLSAVKRFEIDTEVWDRCSKVVIHTHMGKGPDYATVPVKESGEIPYLAEGQGYHDGLPKWPELAELVSGFVPGRERPDEITGFLNSLGLGTQFAAAGYEVYRRAVNGGAGAAFDDKELYQRNHS